MFDFFRNLNKPAAEKRQERLNAYLDGALSADERRRFENELERDADLRAELEQLRWVKLSVQQMPRVRAPRNFILDPALYGQRAQPKATWSLYPGLRVATALTAFFFILALTLDLATPRGALNQPLLGSGASEVAMEAPARQADDVAMLAEPEAAEEPVEGEAADGVAELAPFAATIEGEAATAASEAAAEIVEEEALVAEEPAEEEPSADEPAMPGAAVPEESTERAIEATATADEAADTAEVAPLATATAPGVADGEDALEATSAAEVAGADEVDPFDVAQEVQPQESSFPYLLVLEIVLGTAFVALLVVTLIVRKGT